MNVNSRRREAYTTELTRDFWIWEGGKSGQGKKEGGKVVKEGGEGGGKEEEEEGRRRRGGGGGEAKEEEEEEEGGGGGEGGDCVKGNAQREIPSCSYYTAELTMLFSMKWTLLEGVDRLSNGTLLWAGSGGMLRMICVL